MYVCKRNGGSLLGLKQDCMNLCISIYVCGGSDSWLAVNVCNKAEQAK